MKKFFAGCLLLTFAITAGAQVRVGYPPNTLTNISMPSAFGWDNTAFPITVQLYDAPGPTRTVGVVSVTPESLFDAVSTARTAPGATYYINCATGSDSNNGTASGTPYLTVTKAITSANTGAVPAMFRIAAGTCWRTTYTGQPSPAVDLAIMADGGRVTTGTMDQFTAPSQDVVFTNTYSWTRSSVDKVLDLNQVDRFGDYVELQSVSTAAICNVTPNSFAQVSTTVYVHRADGAAVTNVNTRVFLGTLTAFYFRNEVNVYVGGITAGDGFDVQGGSSNGGFDIMISTPHSTKHVAAVRDSSFKYAGGLVSTAARAVSVDSYNGLAAFFNVHTSGAATDGFNFHNTATAAEEDVLTVNCTGYDNGRYNQQSDNGWTSHENVVGIDVAGYYFQNHGGQLRSINASQSWLIGTLSKEDMGDVVFGGSIPSTAFETNNTAVYWCDRCRIDAPASTRSFYAGDTSAIHLRAIWPTALVSQGAGTVDTPTNW